MLTSFATARLKEEDIVPDPMLYFEIIYIKKL